jgi:hypothetical protein
MRGSVIFWLPFLDKENKSVLLLRARTVEHSPGDLRSTQLRTDQILVRPWRTVCVRNGR